ncbi:MAG TPA: hypothetical protein VLX68_01720 [Chitinivibrionales bacterium]|nr:hypothetical protein [Chitinivibrionales bacterium]
MFDYDKNQYLKEIFNRTNVLRKPISGIVSGYHELPYILVAPDEANESASVEINGKINVSPKFIITPSMLGETFGDVFDPETFDKELQGRMFSFAYANKKNMKIESEYFNVQNFDEKPEEHLNRVHDQLCSQENIRTGLIFGPKFKYYPVSLDRFINEIVDREFRV